MNTLRKFSSPNINIHRRGRSPSRRSPLKNGDRDRSKSKGRVKNFLRKKLSFRSSTTSTSLSSDVSSEVNQTSSSVVSFALENDDKTSSLTLDDTKQEEEDVSDELSSTTAKSSSDDDDTFTTEVTQIIDRAFSEEERKKNIEQQEPYIITEKSNKPKVVDNCDSEVKEENKKRSGSLIGKILKLSIVMILMIGMTLMVATKTDLLPTKTIDFINEKIFTMNNDEAANVDNKNHQKKRVRKLFSRFKR
mmetsp:Transcript_40941/g.46512  ORF Transcript_40941/g.46512 Transcript_40941/m.46512 type:complete len:248 (+) Transcript_40941:83-826(+)